MGITPRPAGDAEFDREQIYVVANHQEEKVMNCPHCGKEATGEVCPACNKSTEASVIAAELRDAVEKLNALQASADALKTDKDALQVSLEAAETRAKTAEEKALKVRNDVREKELAALMGADKLAERKDALLSLEDEAYNAVTASLKESQVRKNNGGGIRLGSPEQTNGVGKKLTLR